MHTKKSPADWFRLAKTAYVVRHQECAWCGNVHQVRQTLQGGKHAFNCQRCDFQVSFDAVTGRYHMVPGEELSSVSSTMLDQPIANLL